MGVEIIGVFIPIILIIGAVITIIYLRKYSYDERRIMIEKGVDPSNFSRPRRDDTGPLRASLLLIGAGIGLLLGYFLDNAYHMEAVAYFSMLFIFGGLGLGAAYLIEEKKQRKGREL
ncbi:MAG: DUF6249 domain-containing protein [Bacteroidota bacterium]